MVATFIVGRNDTATKHNVSCFMIDLSASTTYSSTQLIS